MDQGQICPSRAPSRTSLPPTSMYIGDASLLTWACAVGTSRCPSACSTAAMAPGTIPMYASDAKTGQERVPAEAARAERPSEARRSQRKKRNHIALKSRSAEWRADARTVGAKRLA